VPRPLPFALTENTTLEMQRVALLHIQGKAGGGGFEAKRIYLYMLQRLTADQLHARGNIHPDTKKGNVAHMLKFVKGEVGAVATAELGNEVAALAMVIANEEKATLQPYYDTPFKKRTLAGVLVHARRYSLWAEQWATPTTCSTPTRQRLRWQRRWWRRRQRSEPQRRRVSRSGAWRRSRCPRPSPSCLCRA